MAKRAIARGAIRSGARASAHAGVGAGARAPAKTPQIENPGFEAADVLAGWQTWIGKDGRDPVLVADTAVVREGRQSLRVTADEPADVTFGQFLLLPAGTLWRLRAWIKTENLTSSGPWAWAGALHVQSASGATVAHSRNRFGTSDWQEEEVVFRVPSANRVRIALLFIIRGRGTGKAWFDDVRLEPVAADGPQTVDIRLDQRGPLPIDAKQCGQFIEPLCHLVPSMSAQQVAHDSFEEESPWRFVYIADTDQPHRPWYPSGAVHLAEYAYDTDNPFNGKRSQKIEIPIPHVRAGISQDRFYTKKGVGYRLSVHLRGLGNVQVSASLHCGGATIGGPVKLGRAGQEWRKAQATLTAKTTTDNATLTIEFAGPGTLWLDRVYLIGEDAVLGIWRPDVAAALKAMKPGVIRYGGSALEVGDGASIDAICWEQCVGPWDRRAPIPIGYWGGLEPNFVGLAEIVELARYLGAEPLLCVRWTGKTPADAAAQVEYFNGGPNTPMGRLRAQHGRRKPYNVRYWQIGNEVSGDEYNKSLRAFGEAMKAVDPTIKLISSWQHAGILEAAGGYLDYICDHHYGCDDLAGMLSNYEELRRQIAASAKPGIRAAITEWNTTASSWGLKRGSMLTLSNALACARYHNLMQRYADVTEIANRSNCADSFCSGFIQTGPNWLYCTPAYYAQQLYARAAGSYPLTSATSAELLYPWAEPDISAALSADGRTLRIYAVNSTPQARKATFRLVAAGSNGAHGGVRRATVHVLRDREPGATSEVLNTRDDPRRIATASHPAAVRGARFSYAFAPLSLTLLELQLGR
jgi:alpha-N-arabinofuranosidase